MEGMRLANLYWKQIVTSNLPVYIIYNTVKFAEIDTFYATYINWYRGLNWQPLKDHFMYAL